MLNNKHRLMFGKEWTLSGALQNYQVLIADADEKLASAFKSMLGDMGFSNVHTTPSGYGVLEHIKRNPIDFLIIEWNTQHINGIDLVRQIRCNPASPRRVLPVIMLTGRAEQSDISTARDTGINEFVLKPFFAKTIYDRLERIIEKPRQFIAAQNFVGPDRRRKKAESGLTNRRILNIQPKPQPLHITGNLISSMPTLWNPDFSLKQKLPPGQTLGKIITPKVLDQAQASIESAAANALQWIKADLQQIKMLYQQMLAEGAKNLANDLGEVALTINSRAGTFGYGRVSEVAYMLYIFCRNHFQAGNQIHHVIIQKHIEVLEFIIYHDPQLITGKQGKQVVMELHNLVLRFTGR